MKTRFADTSFWFARHEPQDGHHDVARRIDPDLKAAWAWLTRHDERPYSFVDAVSFRVMRRRRLSEALAFDGDFAAAGFVEVRPA